MHDLCRFAGAVAHQSLARHRQVAPNRGELLVPSRGQRDVNRPHGREEERHRDHDHATIDEYAFHTARSRQRARQGQSENQGHGWSTGTDCVPLDLALSREQPKRPEWALTPLAGEVTIAISAPRPWTPIAFGLNVLSVATMACAVVGCTIDAQSVARAMNGVASMRSLSAVTSGCPANKSRRAWTLVVR